MIASFQSTHSLRSATTGLQVLVRYAVVSIHALLAECDIMQDKGLETLTVSIHALLAECDTTSRKLEVYEDGFNPRTPCGVRHRTMRRSNPLTLFQSTHSLRSATAGAGPQCAPPRVSIHALLAECDFNE